MRWVFLTISLLLTGVVASPVHAQPLEQQILQEIPDLDPVDATAYDDDPLLPLPKEASTAKPEEAPLKFRTVILRGLNKVTAKTSTIEAKLGILARFGNLEIVARDCWKAPPTQRPEDAALLDVWERKQEGKPNRVFLGWMFSSSPSLSAMEHPVYDLTMLECREDAVTDPADADSQNEQSN